MDILTIISNIKQDIGILQGLTIMAIGISFIALLFAIMGLKK